MRYRFIIGWDGRDCTSPGAGRPPGIFRALALAALAGALTLGPGPAVAAEPAKAKEAPRAKEGAKAKEAAKAKAPATAKEQLRPEERVAYRVNGAPLRAARLLRYVRNNITMRHAFMTGRSNEIFDEMAQRLVNEEILFQEGKRQGLVEEAEKGYFRLSRNTVIAKDFLKNVIRKEAPAAVTDEQVAAELPHDARTFVIRQIVLETPEEAEAVRARILAGEDFEALARELSIGVEARKGGLLFDYEAGGAVFSIEQEKYLFALPLMECSRVLETGLGHAVVRVEAKKDPRPGTVERWRAKTRGRLIENEVGRRWKEIVAKGERTAAEKEEIYVLVLQLQKGGKPAETPIGTAGGDLLLFSEIVRAQKRGQSPNLNAMQLTDRIAAMLGAVAEEAIVAAHARKVGHKVSVFGEEAISEALRADVLARLREREIVAKVAVKDDELLAYYRSHRDDFNVREAREARILLAGTRDDAVRLLAEIRAGKDFEVLARENSKDGMSRERGGNIGFVERGVVFKDLEEAIFALREPGDLTAEPVRTALGWYIAQLISKRAPAEYTFEESKERVRARLRAERENALSAEVLAKLRAKAKIEADEQVLTDLRKDFAALMEQRAAEPPKKPHHGR